MKRRDLMMRLAEIAKAEGVEMRVSEGGRHTKVWIGDRLRDGAATQRG